MLAEIAVTPEQEPVARSNPLVESLASYGRKAFAQLDAATGRWAKG